MKLSELQQTLENTSELTFVRPDNTKVPAHFHITEMGLVTKHFIDCGGTERIEKKATMQLWTSVDFHHRLKSEKLLKIMSKTEPLFKGEDLEIEVELQSDTIGKYGLSFEGSEFKLLALKTDCPAKENCGVPLEKVKVKIAEVAENCCTPGGGCC